MTVSGDGTSRDAHTAANELRRDLLLLADETYDEGIAVRLRGIAERLAGTTEASCAWCEMHGSSCDPANCPTPTPEEEAMGDHPDAPPIYPEEAESDGD